MEKTFEELALELASARFWDNGDDFVKTAANMMQQVREATIAECYQSVEKSDLIVDAMTKIYYLPPDRIRIEP